MKIKGNYISGIWYVWLDTQEIKYFNTITKYYGEISHTYSFKKMSNYWNIIMQVYKKPKKEYNGQNNKIMLYVKHICKLTFYII